jgi:hypothetical protein
MVHQTLRRSTNCRTSDDSLNSAPVENARQEVQDFVRLCDALLSPASEGAPPINIVECAVIRYYASSLMDRCDALLHDKDGQTLADFDDPPGSPKAKPKAALRLLPPLP